MTATFKQAARVRQNCSGTGLANVTLLAAFSSFQGFADAFQVGSTVTYTLQDGDGVKWEIGVGTLISTTELSRDEIIASSESDGFQNNETPGARTKINLSSNTHQIFNSIPPEFLLFLNDDGKVANPEGVRKTIILSSIDEMVAEAVPGDDEAVVALGSALITDSKGGVFRFDDSDATAPDNVDTFRNANSSTGLYKRTYFDKFIGAAADMTGALARSMRWVTGVSRLAFGAAALFWEIPLTKGGFFVGIHATVSALKGIDAAAQHTSGQYAMVMGESAFGDCVPFVVEWSSSSSATGDDANVFRPSTGAASSGNGRWVRSTTSRKRTFSGGDATPSIKNGDMFETAGSTTITKFDDGFEGQIFTVRRGAADLILAHDPAKINTGGYNIRLHAKRPNATFQMIGGVAILLACDILHDYYSTFADYGAKPNDPAFDNAPALNAWKADLLAGTAPPYLVSEAGVFYFLNPPEEFDDCGILHIEGQNARTEWRQSYNAADEYTGILVLRGGTSHSVVQDIQFATSDGFRGGAGVVYRGNSDLAPSEARMRGCSFTTYTSKPNFAISGATNASQGVFTTSGAHGFANGEALCGQFFGNLWPTLEKDIWEASDVTSTTYKMKKRGTATYCDTTSLGAFSSGTVRSGEAFDCNVTNDGVDKDTGAIGNRVMKIEGCEMFGAAKWAIKCNGASTLMLTGSTIYPAGFNAYIWASGSVAVPTSDLYSYGSKIHGYILDRCVGARHFGDISGSIFTTANTTADIRVWGEIGGIVDDETKLIKDLATRVLAFSAADKYVYGTTSGVAIEATITAAGRAILDDADAAAQRTTLALGTAAVVNTGTSGATIPLNNGSNTLSGSNTLTGLTSFSAAQPLVNFQQTGAATDEKNWLMTAAGGNFYFSLWNDAQGLNATMLQFDRTGNAPGSIQFAADLLPLTTEDLDIGSPSQEIDHIYLQNAAVVSDQRRKNDLGVIEGGQAIAFCKALIPRWFTYKDRVIPAHSETRFRAVEVDGEIDVPTIEDGQLVVVKAAGKVTKTEAYEIEVPEKVITHGRPHAGFFAQQFKEAMTAAGIEDFGGYAYDGESDTHTLRLMEVIAVQHAAIKNLIGRVEQLESR